MSKPAGNRAVRKPTAQTHDFHIRVARSEVGYLSYLIESYENLALVTTVDPVEAVLRVQTTTDLADEVARLLAALQAEVPLEIVDKIDV
jgi:hypothetical protein